MIFVFILQVASIVRGYYFKIIEIRDKPQYDNFFNISQHQVSQFTLVNYRLSICGWAIYFLKVGLNLVSGICRGIPERVYPFNKGVCRNLYLFCCARSSIYRMEPLPTAEELEEKSRPYTCFDVVSCRCCWCWGYGTFVISNIFPEVWCN